MPQMAKISDDDSETGSDLSRDVVRSCQNTRCVHARPWDERFGGTPDAPAGADGVDDSDRGEKRDDPVVELHSFVRGEGVPLGTVGQDDGSSRRTR